MLGEREPFISATKPLHHLEINPMKNVEDLHGKTTTTKPK